MLTGLSACRYLFTITALDTLKLPPYKGSTLRGGFGHAFRKVVCTFRGRECGVCLLKNRCVYSYVFETPPPADTAKMTKYLRAPHPFVIEPPPGEQELFRPGESLSFGLVLIGRANDYLPYFIYAFEELGKELGIGRGKGKFRLERVECGGDILYDGGTKTLKSPNRRDAEDTEVKSGEAVREICLNFLTPTRIVHVGKLTDSPDFQTIFRTLLRRLSMLTYFHCGYELEVDYKGLIERAGAVETAAGNIRWHDWERYSARQDERMKMGGFAGEMSFDGVLEEFQPFLEIGELVHVGKGTGFGLGRYEMKTAGLL